MMLATSYSNSYQTLLMAWTKINHDVMCLGALPMRFQRELIPRLFVIIQKSWPVVQWHGSIW
jgi:hypothetical protein